MTFESVKNTKALSFTIGIHLLLLLLFFFVKYKAVAPLAVPTFDVELTAALGTSDNGLGIDPPELVMGAPAPPAATADAGAQTEGGNTNPAASSDQTLNNAETNDDVAATDHTDAAPVLRRTVTVNKTPNPNTTPANTNSRTNTQQTPAQSSNRTNTATANTNSRQNTAPKYSYTGSNGPGGNGASENAPGASSRGDGTGTGLKGRPGGDPNGLSYSGGVNGRSIVAGPDKRAEFREGGKVSVKVWVNREGTITRYNILSAANGTIRAIAEQKIKAIRFNKLANAPVEQNGTIIINFKAGTGK
ncbi:hypothetical protein [Taibaiella sp. KBW10]|uniref:hypothetical protein n=1 Tax=Taibaiella sp. KBW10 TaxID=2153357 RepID=UPI000F5B4F85|nr:hypothetical protein [Taibaiella sp. KBW10]